MKKVSQLATALFAIAALLASCNTPLGGYVTVTTIGADAAAYKLTGADWTAADNPDRFSFWALGAYEVAVRCDDTVHVLALAPGETLNPLIECEGGGVGFNVSYDVSPVAGSDSASLFYRGGFLFSGSGVKSGTFSASNARSGEQDLVLVANDNGGQPIAAMMITRNVSNGASYTMTMSSSDTQNLLAGGSLEDFSASVPAGWATSGALLASVTPHGTTVISQYLNSSGGSYPSYSFASHDVVQTLAQEAGVAPYKKLSRLLVGEGKALHFRADLPATFDATVQHDYLPAFSGLSYACADLIGFHLQASWAGYKISAFVTSGFLNGVTAYALPDLTYVDGFSDFLPVSGDKVRATAEAICSNKSVAEMSGMPLNTKPTQLQGLDMRIASDVEEYTAP